MNRALSGLVIGLLLSLSSPAQLVVGDVGVTGFLTSQFTVLHANGSSQLYATSSFGGISHAILYDPTQQNTFLVGGVGFLGRITVTGATSATYTPITTSVGIVTQISFDGAELVVCDSGIDQIIRVNPVTGAVTPVTTGAQPWGANLYAACFNPSTGDIFAGGDNAIWRIPAGSSTPVPFASGWHTASSVVSGLVIDPFSLQLVATLLTVSRFVRIDSAGTLTNISAPFAMAGPNALDVDQNGDFVVGASLGATYRVPNAGGAPILIGTPTGITGAPTSVSVVIPPFVLTALPMGFGGFEIAITGIPPGTVEGFTVGSFDVSLPVGTGPIFGLSPDAFSIALVLAFPSPSPGNIVHWTWPAGFPVYPAAPFVAPFGTLAPGTTADILVVGGNAAGFLYPAPVARLTVN